MKYSVSFLLLLAIASNCNGQNQAPSRPNPRPGNPGGAAPSPPQRPAPNAPVAPPTGPNRQQGTIFLNY